MSRVVVQSRHDGGQGGKDFGLSLELQSDNDFGFKVAHHVIVLRTSCILCKDCKDLE